MRIIFSILAILVLLPKVHADHGLYFKSNEVPKESRTGIDITHKNNITYSSSFTIHFDISFRNTETHYGDILSLREMNGNNLIQVNFRDPDLFVVHNKRETKFHYNLDEEGIQSNRWNTFELKVDAKAGMISMQLGHKKLSKKISFTENSEFALSLGVVNKYGFFIDEVPSISIKDLSIRVDGAPKHLWPFRKTDESHLRDVLSSRTAKLYNPDWVVNYHNKWSQMKSFSFPTVPTMVFDKKKEILYFVLADGAVSAFDLKAREFNKHDHITGKPSLEKSQQVMLSGNELVSYSYNKSIISKYDLSTHAWSKNIPSSLDDNPKYWHHNKLIHPISGKITTVCGYGFYSYFNKIQSFDEESSKWEELTFSGDTILPRYLAAFGQSSINASTAYLFGGLGNSLGKQILGKEFYYDLYKIDFATKHVTKLWDYKTDNQFQYLPVNSLKMSEQDSSFYTLMFPSAKNKTYLRAVKINIHEPEINFIGDSIPYHFLDIDSYADVYYWESENKLIAVTSSKNEEGGHNVNLHLINYKPGDETDLDINIMDMPLSVKLFYALLAISLVVLVLVIRKRYVSKTKAEEEIKEEISFEESLEEELPEYTIPQINSFLLFGGFQVFDKNAKDITYRFSPTLKELFLLILLHSMEEGKGISSKRIQEYLWPDKPESKAKNNRGVNIKKLRSILEDVPGSEIVFDNNYWKITLSDDIFCDLHHVQQKIGIIKETSNIDKLHEIIRILNTGALLRDISTEWLDSFKDKNTGIIVNFLERLIQSQGVKEGLRLRISDVIFEFDQMNETALRIKCSLLANQGKHSLAVEVFDHYRKLYLKFYNEEYSYSFKDIVTEDSNQ